MSCTICGTNDLTVRDHRCLLHRSTIRFVDKPPIQLVDVALTEGDLHDLQTVAEFERQWRKERPGGKA